MKANTEAEKAARRAYQREYRKTHREQHREYARKYYAAKTERARREAEEARQKAIAARAAVRAATYKPVAEKRRHAGESLGGHVNIGAGSDMVVHWIPRRVKVETGWRGRPCAGGGACHKGATWGGVELAVDWRERGAIKIPPSDRVRRAGRARK